MAVRGHKAGDRIPVQEKAEDDFGGRSDELHQNLAGDEGTQVRTHL